MWDVTGLRHVLAACGILLGLPWTLHSAPQQIAGEAVGLANANAVREGPRGRRVGAGISSFQADEVRTPCLELRCLGIKTFILAVDVGAWRFLVGLHSPQRRQLALSSRQCRENSKNHDRSAADASVWIRMSRNNKDQNLLSTCSRSW